jgi:hypothetical protein
MGKEMLSLCFRPDLFCLFEARVLQTERSTSLPEMLEQLWKCTLHYFILQDSSLESAKYIKPKYNDDISLPL